jgi:precorrin-6B methylase 2
VRRLDAALGCFASSQSGVEPPHSKVHTMSNSPAGPRARRPGRPGPERADPMLRILAIATFLGAVAGAAFAVADKEPDGKRADAILELQLPESASPPSYAPERVSKLTIDGKDYSTPRMTRRTIAVRLKKGADSVKVVYTFWPLPYTRIIRTKVVKVEKGKTIKVSLLKADPDNDKHYVIFVPTPTEVVDAMCKMADIGKGDVVYDIGCGDGRMVIRAVKKYGAKKGVGIDLSEERIKDCNANAKKAGVEDKVTFLRKDALTIKDFSEASVVLIYLSNALNEALRPTLQKTLKPGSRIVSHRFLMGKWKPDRTETITAKDNYDRNSEFKLHLWTIKKR